MKVAADTKPLLLALSELHRSVTGNRSISKRYDGDERIALLEFLRNAESVWLTPQVLAELTTLISDEDEEVYDDFFSTLIDQDVLQGFKESYQDKDGLIKTGAVPDLGFTDTSLAEFTRKKNVTLMTADHRLINYCKNEDIETRHVEEIYTFRA